MFAFDDIEKNVSYKMENLDTCHGSGVHFAKKMYLKNCIFFEGLIRDKISAHYNIKR
jgi:hypothetical protein